MKIVGYQTGRHDVSYCILENGIPIIHEELERLIRVKEPSGDGLKMYFDRMVLVEITNAPGAFTWVKLNKKQLLKN